MKKVLLRRILVSYLVVSPLIFFSLELYLYDIEAETGNVQLRILLASLTSLLLSILVGILQARRITRSIEEITTFSREVASGNLGGRLFIEEGEIGELAKNINNIAQQFIKRLAYSEEEKHMMEAILRSLSDGLMLVDVKGRILIHNEAVNRMFAVESDIEGRTLAEVLRNAELLEILREVVEGGKPVSREVITAHPRDICLMVTATPFYSQGMEEGLSGVVFSFHDVTRLKHLEEMRRDFVANVSHEIKTPITAIKGFAETLLEGAIDDKDNARKFLETIRSHSERLNSLVGDLLTLSKIEMGDVRIEKSKVDIEKVVDTVFTTLRDKAYAKGLYLRKSLLPEHPAVYADKDRLVQILLNLVDNGIKFTEDGGVTVKVEDSGLKVQSEAGEADPVSGCFMVISVEDTGVGIAKRHLPRLGERFYRVDRARSREMGGTGLGLAIVKHLVKAHGWEMNIDSTPGRGTTVKIYISG